MKGTTRLIGGDPSEIIARVYDMKESLLGDALTHSVVAILRAQFCWLVEKVLGILFAGSRNCGYLRACCERLPEAGPESWPRLIHERVCIPVLVPPLTDVSHRYLAASASR
jgi:hypothetical protein